MPENFENKNEGGKEEIGIFKDELFSEAVLLIGDEKWEEIINSSTAEDLEIDRATIDSVSADLKNGTVTRDVVDCFLSLQHFYQGLFIGEKDRDKKEALGEKLDKITELLNELAIIEHSSTKQ